jgi:hypothetical protein
LKKVISKCNNNPEAIQTALQNFWEDIGNKPSTDEWKTTNKTKKVRNILLTRNFKMYFLKLINTYRPNLKNHSLNHSLK